MRSVALIAVVVALMAGIPDGSEANVFTGSFPLTMIGYVL
jgi:hypothetical protein